MSKLWQKGYDLNTLIEDFTIGEDYKLDSYLIPADCVSSIAHAQMLNSIKILSDRELKDLTENLVKIIQIFHQGEFHIKKSDEDCHTAIENFLVQKIGDAGKKIHTGRSRNDQIIAALRLYTRDFLNIFETSCLDLVNKMLAFADKNKHIPMAGRTHMQKAMPSSVGLWAGAYAEQLMDDIEFIELAYKINNKCPLGSAASYGVPLDMDRDLVSSLLGFEETQNNVLYVQNSRGKTESLVLDSIEQVALTLSKIAQDLVVYSMPEFAYFKLPDQLCTGSSIMPQKKNPDALELMRAKSSTISSYAQLTKNIVRNLPSGYNRDFQETKEPYLRGITLGLNCVEIMKLTFDEVDVNEDMLIKGFTPEIYATDAAFELVLKGMPFREAYKEVGSSIESLGNRNPYDSINSRKYPGTTGNLNLDKTIQRMKNTQIFINERTEKLDKVKNALIGENISLFNPLK